LYRKQKMAEEKMPHPGHDKHLCWLTGQGFHVNKQDQYKKLVKDGKFMCKGCGRVAAKAENLCDPVEL